MTDEKRSGMEIGEMTNYQFLEKYLELQKDITFDELVDLGFATICYGADDSSPFWNNALVNQILTEEQIHQVEQKLREYHRKPAFYFENRVDLLPFSTQLSQMRYEQVAEDSLMFHSGEGIDESKFENVRKVLTLDDLEVFITTMDNCYQENDPQNPYGRLGEYLQSAKKAWIKHQDSNRLEYFIAFKEDEPVAVSALTNLNQIGYISNVGSLQKVRGQGYGKLATLYCVSQSKKHGNTIHSIITEEGTHPNMVYKKMGFETKFTAKLMVKSN